MIKNYNKSISATLIDMIEKFNITSTDANDIKAQTGKQENVRIVKK